MCTYLSTYGFKYLHTHAQYISTITKDDLKKMPRNLKKRKKALNKFQIDIRLHLKKDSERLKRKKNKNKKQQMTKRL